MPSYNFIIIIYFISVMRNLEKQLGMTNGVLYIGFVLEIVNTAPEQLQ